MDVFDNEILRGVVGSTAHGTAIDGQDDRDEMGIFIESLEQVCGLSSLDHYIQRSQPEGVRSGPGDLDLTLYSLRKFCRLAVAGNPSVVILLWLKDHMVKDEIGERLIRLREEFISKESGQRFLGYLIAQKKRLKGELSRAVNRPELVEKYGYDTKFAVHALRLGYEGIELLTDGRLTLPVPDGRGEILRGVRLGRYSYREVIEMIEDAEAKLRGLVEGFGKCIDTRLIDRFLVEAHKEWWG